MADILRLWMLMIGSAYEDANDAASLRHDPAFKLALGFLPDGAALYSRPTISRLENLPRPRELLRMGQAMVGLYCASFRQVPRRITVVIDDIPLPADAHVDVLSGRVLKLTHSPAFWRSPLAVRDGQRQISRQKTLLRSHVIGEASLALFCFVE